MAIEKDERPETNPDPITGAPGAHPVGVGLGAAAGGIAAGAAAGTLAAGPIGTVVGAAIGAVVGGLAGKGAAESMNPTQDLSTRPESDLRLATGGRADAGTVGPSLDLHATDATEAHPLPRSMQSPDLTASGGGAGVAALDSNTEDAYWRSKYRDEPYYSSSRSYDDYAPAYRLAHQRRTQYGGSYDASEGQLASEWERAKGVSRLTWAEARQASRAAWNRLEGNSRAAEHPSSNRRNDGSKQRMGDDPVPLNPEPSNHVAFQSSARDAVASATNPGAMDAGHLSDAAHRAWDPTADDVAVARAWDYTATPDHNGSQAMHTVREAVRSRPFAAIGIGMAVGFLLIGGPSLSRAISRARRF